MPTLEPRFQEIHHKIDANKIELMQYTDTKSKMIYDELANQIEKLDKKVARYLSRATVGHIFLVIAWALFQELVCTGVCLHVEWLGPRPSTKY